MTVNFPKSDGQIFYADEANLIVDKIIEIYAGNGFDSSIAVADRKSVV